MRKEVNKIVIASTLILGLFAGPALAQTGGSTQPQQQMGGSMQNGMMGQGMMGGNWGMMSGNQSNWSGMGCTGMMGGGMMNRMTPSQQQEFMNQTTELRKEMVDLRYAYGEAMRRSASPKELAQIEKKMLELRLKMMNKMQNPQVQ